MENNGKNPRRSSLRVPTQQAAAQPRRVILATEDEALQMFARMLMGLAQAELPCAADLEEVRRLEQEAAARGRES